MFFSFLFMNSPASLISLLSLTGDVLIVSSWHGNVFILLASIPIRVAGRQAIGDPAGLTRTAGAGRPMAMWKLVRRLAGQMRNLRTASMTIRTSAPDRR